MKGRERRKEGRQEGRKEGRKENDNVTERPLGRKKNDKMTQKPLTVASVDWTPVCGVGGLRCLVGLTPCSVVGFRHFCALVRLQGATLLTLTFEALGDRHRARKASTTLNVLFLDANKEITPCLCPQVQKAREQLTNHRP